MALGTGYDNQECSVARALEAIGERWTLLIVRDLFLGVRRFSDLQVHLDISKGVLTDRLGALVDRGLVSKLTGSGHPEYELTEAGIALYPVLQSLAAWGQRYGNPEHLPSRIYVHICGTALDPTGRCPDCGVTPPPADVISSPDPDRPGRRTDPVSIALRKPQRLLEPISR